MEQQLLKEQLGQYAAQLYKSEEIIGVGGGTTVECFVKALAVEQKQYKSPLVVASTHISSLAKSLGFQVISWRSAQPFKIYIDGADFISPEGYMIKGKGGAALGEKIISSLSQSFICLFDASKEVGNFNAQPIYVEILPKASSIVAKELLKHSIKIKFIDRYSENNNWIMEAMVEKWESIEQIDKILNCIPGIISHGLFTKKATSGIKISSEGIIKQHYY